MALTVDDLFTPETKDEILSEELTIATALGLNTTAWQSGQPSRTILALFAQKVADALNIVAVMNKGGFLDTSATVTPEGGPGWLDILASSVYNVTRIPATYADVTITFTAVGATGGTFAPGDMHLANGSITFTNTATFTIPANGTVSTSFQADIAGAGSNSGVGTINTLVTPLVGVTCTNAAAAIGSDAESNANLVSRCRAKLSTLSPDGPSGAYDFAARTINGTNKVQVVSGALTQPSQPVTRSRVVLDTSLGTVTTYVASASGAYATPPNYTTQAEKSIVGTTNASPIAVHVTAHGYVTGDQIFIKNHLVNTAANGSWVITSVDADHFSLDGSTGNGVGVATGTAYRYSDLDLIDKSIQENAVPLTITETTLSAAALNVAVIGIIYVTGATSGLADITITTAASTAVSDLAATIPIGGVGTANKLYLEALRTTIFGANPNTVNVTLSSPASDVTVGTNQVVTISPAPVFTVVRV